MTALTFHLPPDASPDAVQAIVSVLTASDGQPISPAQLRVRAAEILGKQPRSEALALTRDLGLVTISGQEARLTSTGAAVAAHTDWPDLIHGICYFAWSAAEPRRLSRMWTYRTLVDLLWESMPLSVNAPLKKQLVEDLLARAEHDFGMESSFDSAHTSIGPKTVDGLLCWLERLTPPLRQEGQLRRRQRCAPLLLVLALTAVAAQGGMQDGTGFRLGAEERATLCRACLLEPASLDPMLEWTVKAQPQFVRWGTLTSTYGRQIMIAADWKTEFNALAREVSR